MKAAILRRYNINDEMYRQRFRSFRYKPGKTPTEMATRLTDLEQRWLKDCDTVEKVKDVVVKEKLLATLLEDFRMWAKERKPKTMGDATQLAEDYFQASTSPKTERVPTDPCPRFGVRGHFPTNFKPSTRQQPSAAAETSRNP